MVLTRVYAVHYNRPDFILLQKQCLDRWFLEPFEFTVINNAPAKSVIPQQAIETECARLGVGHIRTESTTAFDKAGKHHADALNQVWRGNITAYNDFALVLDGDVFLLDNFCISDLLGKRPVFGVPQHRKIFNYISPTVVGIDLRNTMMVEDVDWEGKEIVPGVHLDTGGGWHPWCHAGSVFPLTNTWHIKAANNNLHTLPTGVMSTYREGFDVELYGEKWLHYCRSSGWDWPDGDYVLQKTEWLLGFLDKRQRNVVQLVYSGFNIGVNDWLGWV